jgi:signal peptidase II
LDPQTESTTSAVRRISAKERWLAISVAFDLVLLDQATKWFARANLVPGELHSYLGGCFWIRLVRNHGAFLSLGATLSEPVRQVLLVVLVGLFLAGALVWMVRARRVSRSSLWATTAIVAGGAGNLWDRIMDRGGVTDFLNVGIGNLRTGIFNVADMYITGVVIWLLAASFLTGKKKA